MGEHNEPENLAMTKPILIDYMFTQEHNEHSTHGRPNILGPLGFSYWGGGGGGRAPPGCPSSYS